jgi:hypothetical protein
MPPSERYFSLCRCTGQNRDEDYFLGEIEERFWAKIHWISDFCAHEMAKNPRLATISRKLHDGEFQSAPY